MCVFPLRVISSIPLLCFEKNSQPEKQTFWELDYYLPTVAIFVCVIINPFTCAHVVLFREQFVQQYVYCTLVYTVSARACASRVTVLGLCVCVCVFVCLSVPANLAPQATKKQNSDTSGLSATWTLFQNRLVRETRAKKANMQISLSSPPTVSRISEINEARQQLDG